MLILCPHWIFYTFMNTLMYVMYINPMKFNVSIFTKDQTKWISYFNSQSTYRLFFLEMIITCICSNLSNKSMIYEHLKVFDKIGKRFPDLTSGCIPTVWIVSNRPSILIRWHIQFTHFVVLVPGQFWSVSLLCVVLKFLSTICDFKWNNRMLTNNLFSLAAKKKSSSIACSTNDTV